ncbi:6-phosphogluconolactonase [Halosquirtibacter xylanolyticus]|uniref:6-phosphogluconolactonase n=1 Tax=Halosquirtibacter xylanolyticus TaxID=3374599 RepID=UPI00374A8980|nr:6-phosphogluconolactonase [Prolixibacteraceae bacterium]
MKEPKYITYKTSQDIAEALIHWLDNWLKERDNQETHIAISGGSTPKLLFSLLPHMEDIKLLENVHFWWVDERCVASTDNDSNYKYFKELFLDKVDLNRDHIHHVIGEANPDDEAQRYGNLIEETLPTVETWPIFDLVLLGMGDDGHTASIFPYQMEFMTSHEICEVATHPVSGQKRITLTGSVINRSKQVIFLVTGKNKKKIFNQIKNKDSASQNYPASHITSQNEVLWFIDKEVE